MGAPKPPPGYRFDAFADVRMGRSLFQMEPEDWLVKDGITIDQHCPLCHARRGDPCLEGCDHLMARGGL